MKKGFTLIELLGVIIVLAIIALITIPIISNVVNKARLQSLKSSAYGLLDAANLYYAEYEPSKNIRFNIEDNKVKSNDTNDLISYKGNIKDGVLILDKKGNVTVCVTDGKNSAYKNYNEKDVTLVSKQTCYIPDNKSIVYLEDTGATRDDLTTQELTDEVESLKSTINSLKSEFNTKLEAVSTIANSSTLDKVYPVGSIYITVTEDTKEKVQAKFGGTWVAYGKGRTLVGVDKNDSDFNEVEKTGGEKTHTLTVKEMPDYSLDDDVTIGVTWRVASGTDISLTAWTRWNTGMEQSTGFEIPSGGSSQPHNNLQPYITVYMYKRTA